MANDARSKRFIGKRNVNTDLDPDIPLPEQFKTAEYLENLLKKGVRYKKQMHLMLMLITRTIETGGITILRNDVIKESFKYLYGISVSDRQICNLLKKLENDKQIHIKIKTIRSFDKSGKPVFKKKRFVYVWASYFFNNCKLEEKLSRFGNISILPEKSALIPIKYKVTKKTQVFVTKYKKIVTINPFIENKKDPFTKGLLPKWFNYGLDDRKNINNSKIIVWGFDDIKSYRDQNIKEFINYMGYSPEFRIKQRKKELAIALKGRKYEFVSDK
jgi:hypothetical protein